MSYFSVIWEDDDSKRLTAKVFYDFDEACIFAHDLVKKGIDSAGVLQYLRDYFVDQPMVEYIEEGEIRNGNKS